MVGLRRVTGVGPNTNSEVKKYPRLPIREEPDVLVRKGKAVLAVWEVSAAIVPEVSAGDVGCPWFGCRRQRILHHAWRLDR